MSVLDEFESIRQQFPILDQQIHGHPLVYLDSAATSQKPESVIEAESEFYRTINAGVHRGAHELAARSTVAFEESRAKIARLVNANAQEGEEEIVFTAGATASLNLLATAFGNASLGQGGAAAQRFALHAGDEIVVSKAEHHSVLLPFQELAQRTGATLKWFDLDDEGRVLADTASTVITAQTKSWLSPMSATPQELSRISRRLCACPRGRGDRSAGCMPIGATSCRGFPCPRC
jgi:cysteine desulfurase/selenocysteine lyase